MPNFMIFILAFYFFGYVLIILDFLIRLVVSIRIAFHKIYKCLIKV